jgi:hypothetical protein
LPLKLLVVSLNQGLEVLAVNSTHCQIVSKIFCLLARA